MKFHLKCIRVNYRSYVILISILKYANVCFFIHIYVKSTLQSFILFESSIFFGIIFQDVWNIIQKRLQLIYLTSNIFTTVLKGLLLVLTPFSLSPNSFIFYEILCSLRLTNINAHMSCAFLPKKIFLALFIWTECLCFVFFDHFCDFFFLWPTSQNHKCFLKCAINFHLGIKMIHTHTHKTTMTYSYLTLNHMRFFRNF